MLGGRIKFPAQPWTFPVLMMVLEVRKTAK